MKSMNKKSIAMITALIMSQPVWSCGGGESIVLNDDTILSTNGLTFPVTDPTNQTGIDAEKVVTEYLKCIQQSNPEYLPFTNCEQPAYLVGDSKNVMTHEVIIAIVRSEVQYTVTDLNTKEVKFYTAMLGARGGCGLQVHDPRAR